MKGTGFFVTEKELERVKAAMNAPVMYLSGGRSMHRSPGEVVADLERKYRPPAGSGLNLKTGEFCIKE